MLHQAIKDTRLVEFIRNALLLLLEEAVTQEKPPKWASYM
jgi:hypothetical protein